MTRVKTMEALIEKVKKDEEGFEKNFEELNKYYQQLFEETFKAPEECQDDKEKMDVFLSLEDNRNAKYLLYLEIKKIGKAIYSWNIPEETKKKYYKTYKDFEVEVIKRSMEEGL